MNKKTTFLLCVIFFLIFVGSWGTVSGDANMIETSPQVLEILAAIEKEQASMTTLQTDFIQKKKLAVFDQELVLEGSIAVEKPGRISWRVLEPMKYNMVIEEKVLRQWDESSGQVQTVSLSDNPMFGAMIHQMNAWFSGEYTSMADQYHISLLSEAPIALRFSPRETASMFNVIENVGIEFSDDRKRVHHISILDQTGDRTSLTFVNPRMNVELDPGVWKVQP